MKKKEKTRQEETRSNKINRNKTDKKNKKGSTKEQEEYDEEEEEYDEEEEEEEKEEEKNKKQNKISTIPLLLSFGIVVLVFLFACIFSFRPSFVVLSFLLDGLSFCFSGAPFSPQRHLPSTPPPPGKAYSGTYYSVCLLSLLLLFL